MKHALMTVFTAVTFAAPALAEDPIAGVWLTQPDEGAAAHVKIAPCGAELCGTIIRTFKDGKEFRSETIGKKLVQNMRPVGDARYEGQLWRPANGKIYSGEAELKGNSIDLRGCVAAGLICATQVWTRVE